MHSLLKFVGLRTALGTSAGVCGSSLDPHDFSCLGVVLNMALTPTQPHEQPMLYEQCLQLLYSLSEHLQTRGPMLTLLRQPPYSMLTPQIRSVLQSDEPGNAEVSTASDKSCGRRSCCLALRMCSDADVTLHMHESVTVCDHNGDVAHGQNSGVAYDQGSALVMWHMDKAVL